MILNSRSALIVALTTGAALLLSAPAQSLTGEDVVERMSSEESNGYLAGAIEMAAFLSGTRENSERSDCIMNWYYEGDGVEELIAALTRYKDRQALPVIHLMINRACGELVTGPED
jgi:hypothetical protein